MVNKETAKKVSKKAVKKVSKKAVKKVAKKATEKREVKSEIRDVMDPSFDFVGQMKEALALVEARTKNKSTHFVSYSEIQSSMVPFGHFLMQWLFGSYGIPSASVVDIIGAEHLGKSTNLMTWMGWAQLSGCPILVQLSESKPLTPDRVRRCMSTDPEKAEMMLENISVEKIHSLDHSVEAMEKFVKLCREGAPHVGVDPLFPDKTKPIVIGVDSWSKFMSKGEAVGVYNYGDNLSEANKKKAKAIGEASNLGHSQHAAAWCRRLPYWLSENNVIVIMVHHQNDKIDMSGAGLASYMSADASALYNKTKIGGRALNQNAAMQVILARKGLVKDGSNNPIGTCIKMRADKNSYGPANRVIEYNLINEMNKDTENYLQSALDLDEGLCNLFVDKKILGTTVKSKRYSSKALGIEGATASEFSAMFHADKLLMAEVGKQLNITGYSDVVDQIKEEMELLSPEEDTGPNKGGDVLKDAPPQPLEVGEFPKENAAPAEV
jgi:RecA/RadA recombinase